jgi:HPt (histidine-containing phosphotransfer) domain-containing protein
MTGVRDPAVEDVLAAVRRDFASRLPERGAELVACLARGAWEELRRAAHKLRGSASTYGFAELGAHAAAIDDLLIDLADAGGSPDPAAKARLEALVGAAVTACERAASERA